jgi:predicted Rossmann fold nucleotide-binding protein DprA/Smf involved in DNA uptake
MTGCEDGIRTSVRAELIPVESESHQQRAARVKRAPGASERPLYGLLSVEDAGHMDDLVENSDWRLAKVLGALFDRELRGVIRQLPGKQFLKVLL